jgi:alpha-mannosidase
MVYEDAEKLYAEVAKDSKRMFKDAMSNYMSGLLPLSAIIQPSGSGTQSPVTPNGRLVAFNTVHHSRREIVEIPLRGSSAMKLRSEVVQVSKDGSRAYAMMHSEENSGGVLWAEGLYADLKSATGKYT